MDELEKETMKKEIEVSSVEELLDLIRDMPDGVVYDIRLGGDEDGG